MVTRLRYPIAWGISPEIRRLQALDSGDLLHRPARGPFRAGEFATGAKISACKESASRRSPNASYPCWFFPYLLNNVTTSVLILSPLLHVCVKIIMHIVLSVLCHTHRVLPLSVLLFSLAFCRVLICQRSYLLWFMPGEYSGYTIII